MGIFNAIGFGILLIVLHLFTPAILSEGEKTAIAFLQGAQVSANVASSIATRAENIQFSNTQPNLPQTPQIRTR